MILGVVASSIDKGGPAIDYSIENAYYDDSRYDPTTELSAGLETLEYANGKLYLGNAAGVWEYTYTDGQLDLTTYNSVTSSVVTQSRDLLKIGVNGDNILSGNFSNNYYRRPLSTSFDITSAGSVTTTGLTEPTEVRGMCFNSGGTKLYVLDSTDQTIYQYTISPAWSGAPSYDSKSLDISSYVITSNGTSVLVSPDDKYIIVGQKNVNKLDQWLLDTVDVGSSTYDVANNIGIRIDDMKYNPTGDFLIIVDSTSDEIYQAALARETSNLVIITESLSATWTPPTVTKTGDTLKWTAVGDEITTQSFTSNTPTFDFSANTGNSDIVITVESTDGWSGLTDLRLYELHLLKIDVSVATNLDKLYLYSNYSLYSIRGLDELTVATSVWIQNTDVSEVTIGSNLSTVTNFSVFSMDNSNFIALDITVLVDATTISCDDNVDLATFDMTGCASVTTLKLSNNNFNSATIDAILNELYGNALSNGLLTISAQNTSDLRTSASDTAWTWLDANGWTLDIS